MFRTIPLSIIRSFSLYTQQWYMSYRFVGSLRAGSERNWIGSAAYIFRTIPVSIIRSFSLYTQQWYMSYRFVDSLRAGSGRNVLILLASCMTYTIIVCVVKNSLWWIEQLSETCSVLANKILSNILQVNSIREGNYRGSSMWLSTQQVDYWSYILHPPYTWEKMGIQWTSSSVLYSLQESLRFG